MYFIMVKQKMEHLQAMYRGENGGVPTYRILCHFQIVATPQRVLNEIDAALK